MTQTLNPAPTASLTAEQVWNALHEALVTLAAAPLDSEAATLINGRAGATYGQLIRITAERLPGDPGPRWNQVQTYTLPEDADVVLTRMAAEDRVVYAVEATRGALGGTTRV